MRGVIVLLLKDYLKLGLTGALLTFLLFRCRKVLFNDRERSVTCQRYSFRPTKLNEQGSLHFLQVPCQMYWMHVTKIMLFFAFFIILWQMYSIHSSVFIFVKGYPECDPSFPFLNEKFLNQRAATKYPFNKEHGKKNINIFHFVHNTRFLIGSYF